MVYHGLQKGLYLTKIISHYYIFSQVYIIGLKIMSLAVNVLGNKIYLGDT
jgi:hypothetical protein